MISDLLFVFAACLLGGFFAEGLSWLLIYRTESYKSLQATISDSSKRLDKLKDEGGSKKAAVVAAGKAKKTSKDRKADRYEDLLKNANRDLSFVRMKSMFAVTFSVIALLAFLNSTSEIQIPPNSRNFHPHPPRHLLILVLME
eukprot:TRINITY_DN1023_c0_g1_i1.p1 TRINITY_DN1023_c0_g1~~TRINITY_DN1023_c0_g1_i1.p1  ORF type:complete len:143 (-),score=47.53 TRINITY_DN1023_c0_g1_i1:260-688(-)